MVKNMKTTLAKKKEVRGSDNLQNSPKWKYKHNQNVRNCRCQCTLFVHMDWKYHRHNLDGSCYAFSTLRKVILSCTCYTLSICEQVTSTLPIQEVSSDASAEKEVTTERLIARSIAGSKIQGYEKFWRVFFVVATHQQNPSFFALVSSFIQGLVLQVVLIHC